MKIKFVDCKNNELINVKVEVNEYMYIVVPEIVDHRFDYIKPRLMDVRGRYMKMFLENTGLCKEYEKKIYDEMKDVLITEAENIHRNEGIMYYTI
jgi:hypothetical protein